MNIITGQNKKIYLIAGAAVLVLIVAAVWLFWFKKPVSLPKDQTEEQAPKQEELLIPEELVQESAAKESNYGTLPEKKSLTNPLENSPGLNPAERTNPFKDAYKNPFER